MRSAGFVSRAALEWRVLAREEADEAACEAEAAAARRSGSGIWLRVVGEGRSVGGGEGGDSASEGDMLFFPLMFLMFFFSLFGYGVFA